MNKNTLRRVSMAFAITVVSTLCALTAFAQGKHPAYLHALSDLRAARGHLERPNHGALKQQEKDAIAEIDATIRDIKAASIDDGKDLNDHPPVDAKMDWPGRIHRSIELLNKAHSDIAQEEDNKFAQGLQQKAFGHIDKAIHHANAALQIAEASH